MRRPIALLVACLVCGFALAAKPPSKPKHPVPQPDKLPDGKVQVIPATPLPSWTWPIETKTMKVYSVRPADTHGHQKRVRPPGRLDLFGQADPVLTFCRVKRAAYDCEIQHANPALVYVAKGWDGPDPVWTIVCQHVPKGWMCGYGSDK